MWNSTKVKLEKEVTGWAQQSKQCVPYVIKDLCLLCKFCIFYSGVSVYMQDGGGGLCMTKPTY